VSKALIFALLLLPVLAVAADQVVYRWVDQNGVVHYSDQPHPGAVKVDLGAPQVVNFKVQATVAAPAVATTPPKAAPPHYDIRILAPAPGTTLWLADFEADVDVSVSPALASPYQLQYELDGSALGRPTTSTRLRVKDVYRGTHTLTVTALAPDGATAGSASSTFYVHHPSDANRNRNKPPGGG
jgi:Domain of unknown function (DUF4124)